MKHTTYSELQTITAGGSEALKIISVSCGYRNEEINTIRLKASLHVPLMFGFMVHCQKRIQSIFTDYRINLD
jgi:hypothetical protein